jgi:hypothetical protein
MMSPLGPTQRMGQPNPCPSCNTAGIAVNVNDLSLYVTVTARAQLRNQSTR